MLVYKYRGGAFERDLKSLMNNEFWASNTKQLNDPCDGFISIKDYQQQINNFKNIFSHQITNITLIEQSLKKGKYTY